MQKISRKRLAKPIGESLCHLGEPDKARQKDQIKIFPEK